MVLKSRIAKVCAFVVVLLCFSNLGDAGTQTTTNSSNPQKNIMSTERLVKLVKDGNTEANAVAAELGVSAAAVLAALASDPKPRVRHTAMICLETVGGDKAIETAMAHMEDADEQTAGQALMVLLRHPPQGRDGELLTGFDHGKYAATRLQTPLIAGRLAPNVDPEPWKKRYAAEQDAEVKENLLVALARMGNAEARAEFARRLKTDPDSDAPRWIEHAKYMEDPWVVPHLIALLDRRGHAMDLAPDFKNPLPQRVCDLAAKAVVEISKAKVDFPMERVIPFTDDELAAIRRAVSK
jgi:hypothetical protein